jgi:hypothetical protein
MPGQLGRVRHDGNRCRAGRADRGRTQGDQSIGPKGHLGRHLIDALDRAAGGPDAGRASASRTARQRQRQRQRRTVPRSPRRPERPDLPKRHSPELRLGTHRTLGVSLLSMPIMTAFRGPRCTTASCRRSMALNKIWSGLNGNPHSGEWRSSDAALPRGRVRHQLNEYFSNHKGPSRQRKDRGSGSGYRLG